MLFSIYFYFYFSNKMGYWIRSKEYEIEILID